VPAPGDTLENPRIGTRLVWRETASSTGGQRVSAELWMASDDAERPPHFHPRMNESLTVLDGRAKVKIGTVEHSLGPGDKLEFPAGTPHAFGRGSNEELHVLLEGWPALQWDEFTTKAWTIDEQGQGRRDPLRLALLLETYPDHMYMAAAPMRVQKTVLKVLAAIARRTGRSLP
jgi:quercetin dioxygenase-like cupin family protein